MEEGKWGNLMSDSKAGFIEFCVFSLVGEIVVVIVAVLLVVVVVVVVVIVVVGQRY